MIYIYIYTLKKLKIFFLGGGGLPPSPTVMMRNHFLQGIFSLVKKVTDHAVGFRDIMD